MILLHVTLATTTTTIITITTIITALIQSANSEPLSPPYVAYRTDPYSTPPSSNRYAYDQSSSLYGDKIPSIVLGARGGNKAGSRGRSKVRPLEVSPASASADVESSARGAGRGDGGHGGRGSAGRVGGEGDPRCPLSFRLGLTHQSSSAASSRRSAAGFAGGINGPVVTYPAHPSSGPGRQVIFVENWERLDMLTPSAPPTGKAARRRGEEESMEIDEQFPLLFEGSNFYHSVPILHDDNGDGIMDVTVVDYDGGVYTVGLDYNSPATSGGNRERYVRTAQVPRLYLRRDWVESATNVTKMEEFRNPSGADVQSDGEGDMGYRGYQPDYPPFHSYFEYGLEWKEDHDNARIGSAGGVVSADVLSQSVEDARKIEDERIRRWKEAQEEILSKNRKGGEAGDKTKTEGEDDDAQYAAEILPEVDEIGGDAARGDRRRRLQDVNPSAAEGEAGADASAGRDGGEKADEKPQDPPAATGGDEDGGEEAEKKPKEPDVASSGRGGGEEESEKPEDHVVASSGGEGEDADATPEKPNAADVAATATGDGDGGGGDGAVDSTKEEATANLPGKNDGTVPVESTEVEGSEKNEPEVIDAVSITKKKQRAATVVLDKRIEGEPCGDCYGAGEPDECCNSCAQVVAAYKKKNWGYKKADIAQCVEEDDLDDEKEEKRYGVDDDYPTSMDDIEGRPYPHGGDDEYSPDEYKRADDDYRRHGYDGKSICGDCC